MKSSLPVLYQAIEHRVAAIREVHDWWPCRRGCDHCCRNLGEPLSLTRMEFETLWAEVERLDSDARAEIEQRIAALGPTGPWICPFLDRDSGACRVYAGRPAACRSYGYYASREADKWCGLVDEALEEHGHPPIVWGNQAALDVELERRFGERVGVAQWIARGGHTDPLRRAAQIESQG